MIPYLQESKISTKVISQDKLIQPPSPTSATSFFSSWNLRIPPPGESSGHLTGMLFFLLTPLNWRILEGGGAEGLTVSVTQVASTSPSFLSYSNERTSSVASKPGKSLILEIFN